MTVEGQENVTTVQTKATLPVVTFHLNVPDLWAHALRLLPRVTAQFPKVAVALPKADVAAFSAYLWSANPGQFVPHALEGAPDWMAQRSTALLMGVDDAKPAWPQARVLLNLSDALLPDVDQGYERVVEMIGMEEFHKQLGRSKWRNYQALGIQPETFDVNGVSRR